jgi:hypothetical protein
VLIAYASNDGVQVSVASGALFIAGVCAAVFGLVWDGRLNRQDALASASGTVGQRMELMAAALGEATTLMAELQAHMAAQVAAFDRFYAENEGLETRGDLHRKEAKAVSDLMASTMETAQLAVARSHRRDQWLFFALGVLVAIPVVLLLSEFS